MDKARFEACTSPKEYTNLSEGWHTVRVKATDATGNTDPTPASKSWRVDTVAPGGTVLINDDASTTASSTVTLALSASDPEPGSSVAKMRFKNERGVWTPWKPYALTEEWTLRGDAGTKTVYAQYKDRAGNVSATATDSINYSP